MKSEKEVLDGIKNMGYLTCTPRIINTSYYKLLDDTDTIISALISLHHALPKSEDPEDISINTNIQISVFTPKQYRKLSKFKNVPPNDLAAGVIDDDVKFDVLREDFSIYDISNDVAVSIKTVVSNITKTRHYNNYGEPIYGTTAHPIIKIIAK